jgi:prephenate dehydrogenase
LEALLQQFGTVAIVGVGLIGGSIGLALRTRGLANRVVGVGRNLQRLEEAQAVGAIDEGSTEADRVVETADVVVVCTPTDQIANDVLRLAASSRPDVLITDAGSTKQRIVETVETDKVARRVFVGAHPIAGSERRGVAAARADLFHHRVCVLTTTERTPIDRLDQAERFWSALGCRVVIVDPKVHDAAAYRDGTRVAAADTELWVAIFQENPAHLLNALDEFRHHLDLFRDALAKDDPRALRLLWDQARSLRLQFQEPGPR